MKTTAIALAAALLAGPALASEPTTPAATPPKADAGAGKVETPQPTGKKTDAKKAEGGTTQKAAAKEPPCEPVKPCPIE